MDSDPWADSPPTPRTGTPRTSLERAIHDQAPAQLNDFTLASPVPTETSQPRDQDEDGNKSEGGDVRQNEITWTNKGDKEGQPGMISPEPVNDEVDVAEQDEGGFDDFDDFDEPEAGPSRPSSSGERITGTGDGDDGFGDFGDFEEGDFDDSPQEPVVEVPAPQGPAWVRTVSHHYQCSIKCIRVLRMGRKH